MNAIAEILLFELTNKKRLFMQNFDRYLEARDKIRPGDANYRRKTNEYSKICRELDAEITHIIEILKSAKEEENLLSV
jgi:hypothetical protein